MSKNILITGISGMLGRAIYNHLKTNDDYTLYGISRQPNCILSQVEMIYGDINDPKTITVLEKIDFYSIIHCAAEVNLAFCESNNKMAFESNVKTTQRLSSILKTNSFIYISTDSVFDGRDGNYSETSLENPLNYYANTKFLSENYIKSICTNYIIIRTNIYGFNRPLKNSLFEWSYTELSKNHEIDGFSNMYFSPLYVGQLAILIEKIISKNIEAGIYNLSADETISKYDFIVLIAEEFGLNKQLIKNIKYFHKPQDVERPLNTSLNNNKIKEKLVDEDFSIQMGITMLKNDLLK